MKIGMNADQGVVMTSPCGDCSDPGPQTMLTFVSQDVVSSQKNVPLKVFQPTLQREDGSYIGTAQTFDSQPRLLVAMGSDGSILWQQSVNPDSGSGAGTPVTPQYATADGGAVVTSTTTQPNGSTLLGTLFTFDPSGNLTGQTPDTGAVRSWTGSWYGVGSAGVPVASNSAALRSRSLAMASPKVSSVSSGVNKLAFSAIELALSFWPTFQGNPSGTQQPPTLLMTHMYPFPNDTGASPNAIKADTRKLVPQVAHKFLMGTEVSPDTFVAEVSKTVDAVALVGHSISMNATDDDGTRMGTFPVGLIMGTGEFLVIKPSDPPPAGLNFLRSSILKRFYIGPEFKPQAPMEVHARVLFLAACGALSDPFQYWFNIHKDDKGRVLIIPKSDKGGIPQGVARSEWINIALHLAMGSKVDEAVKAANSTIHEPKAFDKPVPKDLYWIVIGDGGLQLRHTSKTN